MKERNNIIAILAGLVLVVAACAPTDAGDTTTTEEVAPTTTEAVEPATTAAGDETTTTPGETVTDPSVMTCDTVDYAGEPATLSFVWWTGGGDSPSDQWVSDAFDCFSQRYEGSITLDIEFVPGQHDYVEKLTTEYGATGELPIIVTPKRDPNLAIQWIENDELVDLMPYFEADPEWQAISIEASTELNTIDGQLLAAPDTFQTAVGYFYNTEIWQQAGVDSPPQDWDGFFDVLDSISATGVPALSIHTEDTGWSAILVYEALIARTPEGLAFLDEVFPTDFNQPFLVDATTDLQRLFEYAAPDAVGGNFALAANSFLAERTAIMPNGPWMIGDFRDPEKVAEGFGEKIGAALYPGPVAVDDTGRQMGDYAVSNGYSQGETDAAVEFIKWMNSPQVVAQRVIRLGSVAPNLDLGEEALASLDPLAADLIRQVQETGAPIVPNYQGQWNSIIQNETIQQGLPQLALGNITPEEFLQMMTDAAVEGNPDVIPPWAAGE